MAGTTVTLEESITIEPRGKPGLRCFTRKSELVRRIPPIEACPEALRMKLDCVTMRSPTTVTTLARVSTEAFTEMLSAWIGTVITVAVATI